MIIKKYKCVTNERKNADKISKIGKIRKRNIIYEEYENYWPPGFNFFIEKTI